MIYETIHADYFKIEVSVLLLFLLAKMCLEISVDEIDEHDQEHEPDVHDDLIMEEGYEFEGKEMILRVFVNLRYNCVLGASDLRGESLHRAHTTVGIEGPEPRFEVLSQPGVFREVRPPSFKVLRQFSPL